jgi:arylsulfatase A-like enzyme
MAAPNLLLITLDTTRIDALGVYGNRFGHTPHLDQWAMRAVVFENALAPIGTTIPSHASIFTGLYPRNHRVRSNYDGLAESFETLAELLGAAGYETAAWVGFQVMLDAGGLGQGFDEHSGPVTPRPGHPQRSGADVNRMALEWLTQNRDAPFFAWIHYFEPHTPYTLTPYASEELRDYSGPLAAGAPVFTFYSLGRSIPWTAEERRAIRILYDGEVRETDRLIGEVLERLRSAGLDEQTIVIVTADHGQSLGERDVVGHGFSLWEPVIHVPLIIRDPRVPVGRRVTARVGLVDLLPTILDLLGLTAPSSGDGRSVADAVRGETLPDRMYFAEVQDRGSRPDDMDSNAVAVYYDYFKSIWQDGRFSTFDLRSDPEELRPLAPEEIPLSESSIEELATSYYEGVAPAAPRHVPGEVEEELRALGYVR